MPQKKNPIWQSWSGARQARVYGDLMGTLTMLKGLPLAYNEDMQEDKESIFDAFDTVSHCPGPSSRPCWHTLKTHVRSPSTRPRSGGFINATDLADYLTPEGNALPGGLYKLTGRAGGRLRPPPGRCWRTVPLERYRALSPLFGAGRLRGHRPPHLRGAAAPARAAPAGPPSTPRSPYLRSLPEKS